VYVAHPNPHYLLPLKPDDEDALLAPAAVATADHCKFVAVTPSPRPAVPMQSPPKFNNEVVTFLTIKAAPVNDGKAFCLNKKGEAQTDAS
jgi:hypothetical protein